MSYLLGLIVLSSILMCCEGYKILAVFPVPGRSHHIFNSKISEELAKRGHEVTVITPFPQKSPMKNMKEISVESLNIDEEKKYLLSLAKQSPINGAHFMTNVGYIITENLLKHEKIRELLQSKEKYDAVLMPHFVTDALMGIAHHFQCPLILVDTMPQFTWGSFLLSHPAPSSYVPNLLSSYTGHMNFWQRLTNSFYDVYMILYHQFVMLPKHRKLVKKYIPGEPDLYDFLNNASLLLINSHVSTYEAIPQVPNAVEVGGLHIQEPKPLPQDLQKFLDDSADGVVVFTMGSNIKISDLPPTTVNAMIKTFAKLKQNVLMKWEKDSLPGQPKNVRLMKWLPQVDVLAHPNVKAFITHGGLLSTMESIYYGVPVIGIPVFVDQKMNMATAVSRGYAILVSLQELNEEKLSAALDQALNNPSFRNTAKLRSNMMRDRPIKPIDNAMYWIEYVIRHKGAPHLRYPGMDLTWYQRNLLDVIAFVLVTLFLSIALVVVICKRTLKRICRTHDKTKKNN